MAAVPTRKRRRATYADIEAVAEPLVAQILDGTLVTHPRPAVLHARSASRLGSRLGGPFDEGIGGPGGWVILDEPEPHLGEEPDVLVPDLAGWRRERMPELPDAAFIGLAPDWACEVLSPATEAVVRADKMPIHAREKVRYLWLLDPLLLTLEIFRLEGEGWRLVSTCKGDAKVRAEPFEAIEFDLAALWAR